MRSRYFIAYGIALVAWVAGALAQESPPVETLSDRAVIERLLVDGWQRNSANRRELKEWYEGFGGPKTAATDWAYALNRLNLNEFRDVRPLVDSLAQTAPLNWDIRLSQVWLSVFYGDYTQALTRMAELKKDLAKDAELSPAYLKEIYQRLGRLVGFIRGPGESKGVDPVTLTAALGELQSDAPEEVWQAFLVEAESVELQYEGLVSEKTDEQTRLVEEARQRQGVELDQQLNVAAELQTQMERGRDERESVIDEGRTEVAELENQIAELRAEYNDLASRATNLRYEAANLWVSADQLYAAAAREKDPYLRAQLTLQANGYAALARDRQVTANTLGINADGVYRQLSTANANYDQTRALYTERVAQIEGQLSELDRSGRQVAKKIKDLQAEPRDTNSKIAVLQKTAQALTTYTPFPANEFKARFLEAIE